MRKAEYTSFIGSCVNWPIKDVHLLCDMIDMAVDITYATFIANVGTDLLASHFNYYAWGPGQPGELRLKDDWAVSYHRSKYKGQRVYYVRHSSIEYVYGKEKP